MLTLSNRCVVLVANYMVRDFVNTSIEINTVFLPSGEEDIPQAIFKLEGAVEQLNSFRKSDVAADIIANAARFKSTASDNRLGRLRTQNASLQKATLARFKKSAPGLSKGKTILAEMKAASNEPGRIKITARLYLLSKCKRGVEVITKVTS